MATKEEISMVGAVADYEEVVSGDHDIKGVAGRLCGTLCSNGSVDSSCLNAQTDLLAALDAAREGDFEKAEQLHKDASDALIGAHDTQTKLLSQEAGGGEMEMTFIMAHAQDTLMTTMILEKQTRFTIDAYKRIAELEAKLA